MASESERSADLELIAASLRADLADVAAFVESLAVKLEEALPGHAMVERARQGFRGPRLVRRIAVDAGGERLELRREQLRTGAASVQTLHARVSGGIVLKTEEIEIDQWLAALAACLAAEAERSERVRQSLGRLLLDR
jgi:uncharacterized protein YhdP